MVPLGFKMVQPLLFVFADESKLGLLFGIHWKHRLQHRLSVFPVCVCSNIVSGGVKHCCVQPAYLVEPNLRQNRSCSNCQWCLYTLLCTSSTLYYSVELPSHTSRCIVVGLVRQCCDFYCLYVLYQSSILSCWPSGF